MSKFIQLGDALINGEYSILIISESVDHMIFVYTSVARGTRVECRSTRETSRERERWTEYGWKFL